MRTRKVTVKDVAEKAGVSPSTVSRVISDSPRISQKTKDRVLECMDELGYFPNANARSLASKKTGTIGVIVPTTSQDYFLNPFFSEALRGIVRGASKEDYDILLSTNTEKGEELKNIEKFIRGSKVDGILLMSSKVNDESIDYLKSIDFPFSLIGSSESDDISINQVDNDNFRAAYELTDHIIKRGSKTLSMIAGDKNLVVSKERLDGYKKAVRDNGLEVDEDLIFYGSFDENIGYESAEEIMKRNKKSDGLIVTDDLMAYGAVRFFNENNIVIPENIAIGSFNNSTLVKYSSTPLTSVDINAKELGSKAMELLIEAIDKDVRGKKVLVPHRIFKRKSTLGEIKK